MKANISSVSAIGKIPALVGCVVIGVAATAAHAFELSSPTIKNGGEIPEQHILNAFGCTGANLAPTLEWRNAPPGTKSFAITAFDRDAPTGSGWWHWVVINVPSNASGVKEGQLPKGAISTRTDFGKAGYGGPCPPKGAPEHHYTFTLHALSVESLPLDESASGAMSSFMINSNSIASTKLEATYRR